MPALPEKGMPKAGVAQLVERNLAKVEVDGSNPFARSKYKRPSSDGLFSLEVESAPRRGATFCFLSFP